jgi:predicted enzyme related to lactoylglutathione lyase
VSPAAPRRRRPSEATTPPCAEEITITKNETTRQTTGVNGTFAWFELRAPTPEESLAFFTEVLGWKTSEMETPAGAYTILMAGEAPVGGLVPTGSGPAGFISYLTVPDVDAAARRVEQAGGEVLGAPVDVSTVGRLVEIRDRDGAALFLFRGEDAAGPGAFYWNELWAKDETRALTFLTSLLGYRVEQVSVGGAPYHVLNTDAGPAAGLMAAPKGAPEGWLPYVNVPDVDGTVNRAKEKGAEVEGEILDVPTVGRMAILSASDGARFAVITPAND